MTLNIVYSTIPTKNETRTYKLIHEHVRNILVNELNVLKALAHDFVIHNKVGKIGNWNKTIDRKKRILSDRFRAAINTLGYGKDFTIYSFRHTITIDIYSNLIKSGLIEHEAISKLMPITGHKTELELRKYLKDIGAIPPKSFEDYNILSFLGVHKGVQSVVESLFFIKLYNCKSIN